MFGRLLKVPFREKISWLPRLVSAELIENIGDGSMGGVLPSTGTTSQVTLDARSSFSYEDNALQQLLLLL